MSKTVFLFTDSHVKNEGFLEAINNMLTIGIVPSIFTEEAKAEVIASIKPLAKKAGIQDTPQNCWNFFRDTVQNHLHLVLSMSPAGS